MLENEEKIVLAGQPSPTPEVVDLSIAIVSYNTAALLEKCLAAVYATSNANYTFEVLVVDNFSGDESVEMVKTHYPQARIIANQQNRGFAAASNQALEMAQGTYWLLLNPDTEIQGEALWQMVAFLEAEPQAAVVGPALLYPDGTFQEGAFRFPSLFQIFFEFFPLNWRFERSRLNGRFPRRLYENSFPQAFEIDFPLGACLMVRSSVAHRVGLLDEDFFMYAEEIDWCYRVKQTEIPAGYRPLGLRFRPGRRRPNRWKIYCLPAARVIHHGGASTSQFREEMQVQLYKSRAYFYKKHYSRQFQFAARLLTRTGLAYQLVRSYYRQFRTQITPTEGQSRRRAYGRIWRFR